MMLFCLHPDHARTRAVPWFLSDKPARYCPLHAAKPKPRLRIVDGQWVPVQAAS